MYNLGTDLDVVFTGASVSNGVNTYSLPSQVSHNLTTSAIGPRHGSVVKITSEQYTELKSVAFSTELPADSSLSTPTQPADRNNGIDLSSSLVAQYFVNSNVTADATSKHPLIVDGGVRTSKYIYRVYNPYGNAVEIIYSDNLISASDLDGKINYNPVLPFYKFVNWSVTDIGNDEFKVVPEFTI